MKKNIKVQICGILIILLLVSPLFYFLKSYSIMRIYSYINYKNSFINELDIKIKMPGGLSTLKKDWYPFVMTFNDDNGFSNFIGRDMNYTVLYNFGAFEYLNGASMLYNPNSQYYGAFYGAYFVRELESTKHCFGFDNKGNVDIKEIILPGMYDLEKLVLEGFGLNNPISEYSVDSISEVDRYLNYENWTVIDISIIANGPNHNYKENHQSYIQYGNPPKKYFEQENFPIVNFKSRIYIKYLEEKNCTIFIYIIGPNKKIIESSDKEFLQRTTIMIK